MDDELKAIQSDLDGVLDRLAAYLNRDKSSADVELCGHEEAAQVALHYVTSGGCSIINSIETLQSPGHGIELYNKDSRLSEHPPKSEPDDLADLMDSLRALVEWQINRRPLKDRHMWALYRAVTSWSEKESQYIGESAGLTLTSKREVDRRKSARRDAMSYAYALHKIDPEAFPTDEALFEVAGGFVGMSARTVSRAYYSEDGRFGRDLFDQFIETFSGDPELLEVASQIHDEITGDQQGRQALKRMAINPYSWEVFPEAPRLRLSQTEIEGLFDD